MCKTLTCKLQYVEKIGHQVPVNLPYTFLTSKSFLLQSSDASRRNPERRYIDYKSQLKATQQQKMQNNTITSWESLETFCNKLDVQVVNHGISLILTSIRCTSPRMKLPFKIF